MRAENPESGNLLLDRKKMPAALEKVAPFFNHSELWHVNSMAKSIGLSGIKKCPFCSSSLSVVMARPKGTQSFNNSLSKVALFME